MSVKRQIFINNKGIDGEIANNTTFDFDFNVDKNILEKIKAKKESNKLYKRLGAVLTYGFVYFCDGSCKWMVYI